MIRFLSWLFRGQTAAEQSDDVQWEPAGHRGGRVKNILQDYPEDLQIYVHAEVAGISFRKNDALIFANARNQTIEMEREPGNKHDRNAIAIYGVCHRGRAMIGYVPKEIAAHIARSGMFDLLRPRLARVFMGGENSRDPYLEIQFQILGPKGRKKEFEAAPAKRRKAAAG